MKEYRRNENEDELSYIIRLFKNKSEYDLDYAELFRLTFGIELAPDECRKRFYGIKMIIDKIDNQKIEEVKDKDAKEELWNQLEELKKERIKIGEERSSLNRRLREKAKNESLRDIAYECSNIISQNNSFINFPFIKDNNFTKVGLLTLSDIHYGLRIDEFNNKYNDEICKERFNKLYNNICTNLDKDNIKSLYILGLGDMIEGIIHNINRIESRENIISQIINVSELLANFINKLSKKYHIIYYDVIDNHSRVFADREECGNKDNFSLIIKWYLKSRFNGFSNVEIKDNDINESIGTIKIFNKKYCFVHGHVDKVSDVVQNLSLMTKDFYDGIFIGHMHHFEATEVHGTYVYMNGTFAGNDEYANNLRKTSNPSQNLFIINDKDGIECQYLIRL